MELAGVIERVERVAVVRTDAGADRGSVEAGLRAITQVRSWLAASEAELARRLAATATFPEKSLADCTRGSLNEATKTSERAESLEAVPAIAAALDDGAVTTGHIDAITRAGKPLDAEQRAEFMARVDGLVGVACAATIEQFRQRLALEARAVQRDDGTDRLERQRRATRLRTWTDGEGMVCLSGRFDPLTGVRLIGRLDAAVEALFAEATPSTCPTDPIEKQRHLAALALARLLDGGAPIGRGRRPEVVVVIDTAVAGAGGSSIDWGLPVEIPSAVLADLAVDADVHPVVVADGIVLHAPGVVDLGRTTRLANAAQRRALRALYRTCAVPGCAVGFDRCKLHHVVWWRNGGSTDLANLLPVCAHHHTLIHADGWQVTLGDHRQLTIRFPDGQVLDTGPPGRRAA